MGQEGRVEGQTLIMQTQHPVPSQPWSASFGIVLASTKNIAWCGVPSSTVSFRKLNSQLATGNSSSIFANIQLEKEIFAHYAPVLAVFVTAADHFGLVVDCSQQ